MHQPQPEDPGGPGVAWLRDALRDPSFLARALRSLPADGARNGQALPPPPELLLGRVLSFPFTGEAHTTAGSAARRVHRVALHPRLLRQGAPSPALAGVPLQPLSRTSGHQGLPADREKPRGAFSLEPHATLPVRRSALEEAAARAERTGGSPGMKFKKWSACRHPSCPMAWTAR